MSAPDSEAGVATAGDMPVAPSETEAPRGLQARAEASHHQGAGTGPREPAAEAQSPAVSVRRQVWTLAWPAVLEQLLFALVGLVDAVIVGHLGPVAMTGVGLGGQVTFLAFAAFSGLGVGSTTLIARHTGAREPEEVNRLAWQSLMIAVVVGLAVAVFAWVAAEPAIRIFLDDPEVVALGALWLRVYAFSLPFLAVLTIGNAAMRGSGDTRTPLFAMILVNVINVGVAWTLVRILGVGIAGSAAGAMLGQIAGGVLVGALLWRGHAGIRLRAYVRGLDWSRLLRIFNVGLPASVEQLLLQGALMLLSGVIANMSTASYAAHIITWRISAIAFLPGWGFAVAATTLVGQELGRRDPQRAMTAGFVAFRMALLVMAIVGLPILLFPRELAQLLLLDSAEVAGNADVIRIAAITLQIAALTQLPMAGSFVFSGSLRGAGDTRTTLAITVFSIWAVRLVMAYVLGVVLGLGLTGVWWGIFGDFTARALLFWVRFRFGKWQTIRV